MESREDFEARMAQVIWENRWKKPSAFEIFKKNHMCIPGARVYALEHCVFADHFPRWFGFIVANCPSLSARKYMIENMYVEEVNDPTIQNGHYESLVDFAVALGLDRDFIYSYEGRTYTKLAMSYWDRASRAWHWTDAFAAVAGLEAARGPAVLKLGNAQPNTRNVFKSLGLPDKAMSHWQAAEQADYGHDGHGDMTLKILSEHVTEDSHKARVLKILAETMQVRWFHFDCMGRDALKASGVSLDTLEPAQ
jgi:pyrroloquinoline quinone (PQQ) biosynthesis protein C